MLTSEARVNLRPPTAQRATRQLKCTPPHKDGMFRCGGSGQSGTTGSVAPRLDAAAPLTGLPYIFPLSVTLTLLPAPVPLQNLVAFLSYTFTPEVW